MIVFDGRFMYKMDEKHNLYLFLYQLIDTGLFY